jgi:uncharacterized repeat protein (TIGR04052 family)
MACRIPWNACVLSLGLALTGCEDDVESMLDAGEHDAGEHDAGERDAGEHDAGEHDAGEHDAGEHDAGDASADAAPASRSIELSFEARMGSAIFDCADTYDGLGSSGVSVTMSDFRFYIYDVRLVDDGDREVPLALEQDGEFQHEDVVLLDFENRTGSCVNGTPETNSVVKGTLPAGNFKGLRFGIGVPSALNHADPTKAASPLNLTAMLWPWTMGHLFTRIDARVEGGTSRPSFLIHLGSDGCTGNPAAGQTVSCARPNRAEIELTNFDPARDKVVLDYAKLVAEVALDMDQGGESGCMASVSDPECLALLEQFGVDPATGMPGSSQQAVFSVEPK